jgi:RHS repeat-associated protein
MDLIYQDDGSETRFLLADGLGSVRTEVVSDTVKSVTTYSPYGKVLDQTGTSGTVYGFTGEQHDSAASLLYLRARYYNPYLNQFQSRDPFPGYPTRPVSQHPYIYVSDNPVNGVDPGGLCEEQGDDRCWSYAEYMYFTYHIDWYYVGGLTVEQMQFLERPGELLRRPYRPAYIGDEPPYGPEPFGAGFIRFRSSAIRISQGPGSALHISAGRFCPRGTSYAECWDQRGWLRLEDHEQIDSEQLDELEERVYQQLYNADFLSDESRKTYDTPFWNGPNPDTVVCFFDRCSPRSHINYFAQGAWSSRLGESPLQRDLSIHMWKALSYQEFYVDDTIFYWARRGYYGYKEYERGRMKKYWPTQCEN